MKKQKDKKTLPKKRGRPPLPPPTLKDRAKKYKAPITAYDYNDTTDWIDPSKPLTLEDLGFTLPPDPPTQVVSLRLPRELINEIRALSSKKDVPYQSMMKLLLDEGLKMAKKRYA